MNCHEIVQHTHDQANSFPVYLLQLIYEYFFNSWRQIFSFGFLF